jgi:hypothetical protein
VPRNPSTLISLCQAAQPLTRIREVSGRSPAFHRAPIAAWQRRMGRALEARHDLYPAQSAANTGDGKSLLAVGHKTHAARRAWEGSPSKCFGIPPAARVNGPFYPGRGLRYNPANLLLDPYAHAIHGHVRYGSEVLRHVVDNPCAPGQLDSAACVPRSLVTADLPAAAASRPSYPLADTHQCRELCGICDVRADGQGFASDGADCSGGRAQSTRPARTEHHVCPRFGACRGERDTKSRGCTGHDHDPVVEPELVDHVHNKPLSIARTTLYPCLASCDPIRQRPFAFATATSDPTAPLRVVVGEYHSAAARSAVDRMVRSASGDGAADPSTSRLGQQVTPPGKSVPFRLGSGHRRHSRVNSTLPVGDDGTAETVAIDRALAISRI